MLGGFNKLALVIGNGQGGSGFEWLPTYASGGKQEGSSVRVHEHLYFDFKGTPWTGTATASYAKLNPTGPGDLTWTSFGIRPQYNFTNTVSVAVEAGFDQRRDSTGGSTKTGKLTKLTIAPQLALSRGVWARPVLRAFVSFASWNDETRASGIANGVFGTKGPDIWIWAHDRIGEWISGGLLQPISPSKKMQADIDPLAWKAFTVAGKTWGYPYSIEAISLVYNKAIVPTPPKTWEEVMALDKKLSDQGKKAVLWEYTNTCFTWPLLAANGGYAFKQRPDGTYDGADTGVNNAGALKGVELLNKLLREKYMPEGSGYAEMEGGMAQGKVGMMINGSWSWDNLRKAKIDFGVAKIPMVAGKKAVPFVGVKGIMINKSSPNKDLAVEFIENYMLNPKGLKMINEAEPIGMPASKAYYAELKSDPNIEATMASAQV